MHDAYFREYNMTSTHHWHKWTELHHELAADAEANVLQDNERAHAAFTVAALTSRAAAGGRQSIEKYTVHKRSELRPELAAEPDVPQRDGQREQFTRTT